MRALLIDDERLARAELRRLLAPHPQVEIVGEAASAADAIAQIARLRPQLLFLDVQLPGASGFDVLAALDETPQVIFTTAFDHYALQAFEVNALDYLQKPIQARRLETALERAGLRLGEANAPERRKIFIKDGERCWFVGLDEIRLFESEGNYTRLHFGVQRPLTLRSLSQLEAGLDARRFLRANRRQIVNLDYLDAIHPGAAGGLELLLRDGVRVAVSRRRAAFFKSLASL